MTMAIAQAVMHDIDMKTGQAPDVRTFCCHTACDNLVRVQTKRRSILSCVMPQ
jgi:hypothetical protein